MRKFFMTCLFLMMAAPLAADDYRQDILAHLSERLPTHFQVVASDLQYRDFPGNGGGRLSVAGQLVLIEDLYEVRTDGNGRPALPALQKGITARGYSLAELRDALQRLRYIRLGILALREVYVVTPIGSAADFSAELYYMETVNGIRVSRSDVEFPNNIGLAAGAIPSQYYIADHPSEDAVVQEVAGVIEAVRAERAAEDERARQQIAREAAEAEARRRHPTFANCIEDYAQAVANEILRDCKLVTLYRDGHAYEHNMGPDFCVGYTRQGSVRFELIDDTGPNGVSDGIGEGVIFYLASGASQVTFTVFDVADGREWRGTDCT